MSHRVGRTAMNSTTSVCGSGSGDVAEMEVGLDVGDDSESNESA